MMKNKLKFKDILDSIADEINDAKNRASKIHSAGNIKSSGDEVEDLIREKISLFLPDRYLVKQGHIINSDGLASPQLDIIIFDKLNTPKLFESSNNTVFYPIESVLAIGEIKKTLRKRHAVEFRDKIKFIKEDMKRPLIQNPVFGGNVGKKATMYDIVNLRTDRRFKNPLFSFIFAVDEVGFSDFVLDDSHQFLPNDIFILNYGYLIYGDVKENYIKSMIEDENPKMDTWVSAKCDKAICFGTLLNQLIEHLNKCHISPFGISHYMVDNPDFGVASKEVLIHKLNSKTDE